MKKLIPPFTKETAKAKVQAAEDAWNSKNPERISLAYTKDSEWRNRNKFFFRTRSYSRISFRKMGQRITL